MLDKGQIVEIPATAAFYESSSPMASKKEALKKEAFPYHYGLFDGILLGGHQGIEAFQLGQRKHLNISGMPKPMYIIGMDKNEQRIFVGAGRNHPGLSAKVFFIPNERIHWLIPSVVEKKNTDLPIESEIQTENSLAEAVSASVYLYTEGIYIEFEKKQIITLYTENSTLLLPDYQTRYAEIQHL